MKALSVIILLLALNVTGQEETTGSDNMTKKNSVYLELLGTSMVPSVNYERFFLRKFVSLGTRIGIGYSPENYQKDVISLPVELVALIGRKRHHIEIGFGFTFYWEIFNKKYHNQGNGNINQQFFEFPRIGYRYTAKKGFVFRIGFTPVIQPFELSMFDRQFHPYGGISFGYSF